MNSEMETTLSGALLAVGVEARKATENYGCFVSAHEAYGVLAEEVDEFWAEVKLKREARQPENMRAELIQIAAVAMKAIISLT